MEKGEEDHMYHYQPKESRNDVINVQCDELAFSSYEKMRNPEQGKPYRTGYLNEPERITHLMPLENHKEQLTPGQLIGSKAQRLNVICAPVVLEPLAITGICALDH